MRPELKRDIPDLLVAWVIGVASIAAAAALWTIQ